MASIGKNLPISCHFHGIWIKVPLLDREHHYLLFFPSFLPNSVTNAIFPSLACEWGSRNCSSTASVHSHRVHHTFPLKCLKVLDHYPASPNLCCEFSLLDFRLGEELWDFSWSTCHSGVKHMTTSRCEPLVPPNNCLSFLERTNL
jgi:hypothetical protein